MISNLFLVTNKFSFFPSSYKRPYQYEGTDNANVLLRAETIYKIANQITKAIVVSYPEAISEKIVSQTTLNQVVFSLKKHQNILLDELNDKLLSLAF
jgi:transcription-repair coupling factor (superfamily II helicase)